MSEAQMYWKVAQETDLRLDYSVVQSHPSGLDLESEGEGALLDRELQSQQHFAEHVFDAPYRIQVPRRACQSEKHRRKLSNTSIVGGTSRVCASQADHCASKEIKSNVSKK